MANTQKQKLGSAKRFGTRYGRTTKQKIAAIEQEQRKLHKCPHCHMPKVKRVSTGIWQCKKCNAKFASKAYTVAKRTIIKEDIEEQPIAEEPTVEVEEQEEENEIKIVEEAKANG